jgi:four helix bundle protein
MKYSSFEELPVWKASVEFALRVFEFTSRADFRGLGDTKNQLERSALSISNNIAEGFERGTTKDLINFLYFSRGSAGESRSMLRICEGIPKFSNFKFEISNLISQAVGISKQLHGWINSLINSDIKGVRYYTNDVKKKRAENKQFEEFDNEMSRFKKNFEESLKQREIEMDRTRREGPSSNE